MLSLQEKRALCSIDVTLDGKPAAIAGARLDFGWVTLLDGSMSVEFSWVAIVNVVNTRGGNFKSK